jgi:hypothetical protein
MKKFIVVLSNENDLMEMVDENTHRATFSLSKATKFDSREMANEVIEDLGIRFMWSQAYVKEVAI